jgi:hypothetical protein
MRNGLHYGRRDKRRSTSIPLPYTYPLNNSSKRASNETVLNSQLNSRRTSKCIFNVQDV